MTHPARQPDAPRGASGMIPARATIRSQVQMPALKVIEMAWRGIRLRPGRSLLITSGIVLAVAFLAHVLVSEAVQRGILDRGPRQLIEELRKDGALSEGRDESAAQDADAYGTGAGQAPQSPGRPNQEPSSDEAGAQTRWVVALAMLVGLVGVVNAMLLSVTERFAEIGTMKCLGALDSLIVKLFLCESLLQGLAGTAGGVILGAGLAILGWLIDCGGRLWPLVPWTDVAQRLAISMAAGVGLTVCGALYPALRAARMKPVEAMRLEV